MTEAIFGPSLEIGAVDALGNVRRGQGKDIVVALLIARQTKASRIVGFAQAKPLDLDELGQFRRHHPHRRIQDGDPCGHRLRPHPGPIRNIQRAKLANEPIQAERVVRIVNHLEPSNQRPHLLRVPDRLHRSGDVVDDSAGGQLAGEEVQRGPRGG